MIDPLFLDDLKAELNAIKGISVIKTQERKLREFQDKLASLTFLDAKEPLKKGSMQEGKKMV